MTDITNFIENVKNTVEAHKLDAEGRYARWIWQNADGTRDLGLNEYGCADAANILYTIGEFPTEASAREEWIRTLRSLQEEGTGFYNESTHNTIHTTAHCLAALELFDALPDYGLNGFDECRTTEGLYNFLEGLDWINEPWNASHQGAGIFAALNIAREAAPDWNISYFKWFWDNTDKKTGLWRSGCVAAGGAEIYKHLAGSFHYLFNHEWAKMPLRFPEKMVDSCLDMFNNGSMPEFFGRSIEFLEVDWVYCLTRSLRQCGHRYNECKAALKKFAKGYLDYLLSIDTMTDDSFNDLHMLFGALCCVAELQQALPGMIYSCRPLRLVLDRRPFI